MNQLLHVMAVSVMICGSGLLLHIIELSDNNRLKKYNKRRSFSTTPEPRGGSAPSLSGDPVFVIQKHDATSLHYDVRLEVDGVLKSWAVPKGPSTDPRERRLAIPTGDHPIVYADFEGVIPEGEYGAGPVLIWDKGTFENIKQEHGDMVPLSQAYDNGEILVFLHGKKLRGGYAFIRTDDERLLLIKTDDEHADARRNPTNTEPKSVLSGQTIEEITKKDA
jgi:DNA ligase D-like protein (predicted 3'-phosphoesterase)